MFMSRRGPSGPRPHVSARNRTSAARIDRLKTAAREDGQSGILRERRVDGRSTTPEELAPARRPDLSLPRAGHTESGVQPFPIQPEHQSTIKEVRDESKAPPFPCAWSVLPRQVDRHQHEHAVDL